MSCSLLTEFVLDRILWCLKLTEWTLSNRHGKWSPQTTLPYKQIKGNQQTHGEVTLYFFNAIPNVQFNLEMSKNVLSCLLTTKTHFNCTVLDSVKAWFKWAAIITPEKSDHSRTMMSQWNIFSLKAHLLSAVLGYPFWNYRRHPAQNLNKTTDHQLIQECMCIV